MALGPFISYVPPGVYTRTLTEANTANVTAGLRIPVVIGVGQEELSQSNISLVRGSSSTLDQQISNEDVSLSWVVSSINPSAPVLGSQDGTRTQFRVRNYPIVDGGGVGRVTNDVRYVSVTVNGQPTTLGQLNGQTGVVTLQVPPQPNDTVRVTYYFHRGDTAFTDDVSAQVTSDNATLISPGYAPFLITAGTNDTFKFKVNGTTYNLVFSAGSTSLTTIIAQINTLSIPNLTIGTFTDNNGLDHLRLTTTSELQILDGSANGPLGWTNYITTDRTSVFTVFNRPIVDGSGGGLTTTDPSKVVVKVNGIQVIPTAVDGQNGKVYLALPPPPNATVTISYFANTWQDTFDFLPNSLVTTTSLCGYSPDRATYIQDTDFVISNPSSDVSIIHWGTSFSVSSTTTAAGGVPFDETQIVGSLNDDEMYLAECERVVDSSTVPATVSTTDFLLPEVPTMGNGRNTPLSMVQFMAVTNGKQGATTNRPDLVEVYVGRDLQDAMNRPAQTVMAVDGVNRRVSLKTPVPPDYKAYATFYYNRVSDNSFTFTNKVAGPVGVGQYEVTDRVGQHLYQTRFGSKSGLPEIVQWPRGSELVPDAFHSGLGNPVSELVTVTFGTGDATNAVYTNKGAEPYSFYSASTNFRTKLNSVVTPFLTNLSGAARTYLVGSHVPVDGGGTIDVPSGGDFNLEIDGTTVNVALTTGLQSPATIAADINAAIDAEFGAGPYNCCGFVQVGGSNDVIFYITSLTSPTTLDDANYVKILQSSTAEALGFRTYQQARGTTSGLNKPATVVGTEAGPFDITTDDNNIFGVRIDGVDYTINLAAGSGVGIGTVALAINMAVGATVATITTEGMLRIISTTNTDTSSVVILGGTANQTLGFVQNQSATQTRVTAQDLANLLNDTAGFLAEAIAYPSSINGRTYLTIESLTTGLTTSKVQFVSGSSSAFNMMTGLNIVPGTDGDVGQDAYDNFTVTSSNTIGGSDGTGVPGQTYTDAQTGLRFTVLPSTTGSYTSGGSFTLEVSPTFYVNSAAPFYSIPGMEVTVSNTVGIFPNDTGKVLTFAPTGAEPKIGDTYYLSYKYMKQDYQTRVFRQIKTIEANFGKVSAENRVSLAAYLAILNGSLFVGIKQVLKVPGTNQASDRAYVDALQELTLPMVGGVKPDLLVPLTNSPAIMAQLVQHCETQSLIQNQNERMGFVGFASGTPPAVAATLAAGLKSNRVVAFYPDSAVVTLTDELGQSFESLVDGSFMAAAVAGAVVSPAVDVATPYTRGRILGLTRIPRVMDPVRANQTAVKGVTILDDANQVIRIRQGLTTNMDNVLVRLPTVTQIADFVQQQSRATLDAFIGTKFLDSVTNDVDLAMTALFKQFVQAEIVGAFTGIKSNVDPNDPTVLQFEAYYQPIFPLLYIVMTFNLRSSVA